MAEKNESASAEKRGVVETIKEEVKKAIPDPNVKSMVPQDEKLLAALGYVSFLCVLPLALRPKSEFCQFHGKQALVLVILFFVLSIINIFVSMVGISFIGKLLSIAQIVIIVIGAMNASQGVKFKIPFVSQVAEKLEW